MPISKHEYVGARQGTAMGTCWHRASGPYLVHINIDVESIDVPYVFRAGTCALEVVNRTVALCDALSGKPCALKMAVDVRGKGKCPVLHGLSPVSKNLEALMGQRVSIEV